MLTPYYRQNEIEIYHADCRDVLSDLDFDFVLTDPPYGVTQQDWDSDDAVVEVIANAPLAVFTVGERLLAKLIFRLPDQYRHIWVWDRVNHNTDFLNTARRPMRAHELIAVFSRNPQYEFSPVRSPGVSSIRRSRGGNGNGSYGKFGVSNYGVEKQGLHPRSIVAFPGGKTNSQIHPTEKPVSLYEYLLQSYPSDFVVDPFMGSGTILVAAQNLGRRAVGIEIEEKYCEQAANRLRQKVLF